MNRRRPDSITGLALLLVRTWREAHPAAWRRVLLLGGAVGLSLGVGAVGMVSAPPATPSRVLTQRVHRASTTLASYVGGQCVARHNFCLRDADCVTGDRCVDPSGATELIHTMRSLARARTASDDASILPTVAVSGSRYAVAWVGITDDRFTLYTAVLNADGQRVGTPVQIATGTDAKVFPSLAAGPNGFGLAWTEANEDGVAAKFQRLNAEGRPEGRAELLEDGLNAVPRVVWSGQDYAVAWYNVGAVTQMSLHFARISATGQRVGRTSTAARGFITTGMFGFASMGDGYGLGWNTTNTRDDRTETMFVRVGAGGDAGRAIRVSQNNGQNASLSLAWNGRHFGAVWEDDLSAEDEDPKSRLVFAGVGAEGVAVPRRDLTDKSRLVLLPSLASNGSGYGLAHTVLSSDGIDVMLSRLDGSGVLQPSPVRVNSGDLGALPSLVWTGREYAVAWTQLDAQGISIQFARFDASLRKLGRDTRVSQ